MTNSCCHSNRDGGAGEPGGEAGGRRQLSASYLLRPEMPLPLVVTSSQPGCSRGGEVVLSFLPASCECGPHSACQPVTFQRHLAPLCQVPSVPPGPPVIPLLCCPLRPG